MLFTVTDYTARGRPTLELCLLGKMNLKRNLHVQVLCFHFFNSKKESSKLNTSVGKICANTVETSCLVGFLCEGNTPGKFKNYFTVNSQVHSDLTLNLILLPLNFSLEEANHP